MQAFEKRIMPNHVYKFSNAYITTIDPQYRIVPGPYQWTINKNTFVKSVPESEVFQLIEEHNFIRLNDLQRFMDTSSSVGKPNTLSYLSNYSTYCNFQFTDNYCFHYRCHSHCIKNSPSKENPYKTRIYNHSGCNFD